jgi:predicted porin
MRTTGNGDGGLSTSVFGLRGTEDLGGGTAAFFNLEYDLVDLGTGGNGTNTSSTVADANPSAGASGVNGITSAGNTNYANGFGARLAFIGLRDKGLGELRAGRQAQLIHTVIANGLAGAGNNVAGSFYSSGTNSMLNSAAIRPHLVFVNRAITYFSPNMGGLVLGLQTSNQFVSPSSIASTSTNESSASLTFTGIKNLNVQAAITKVHNNTSPGSGTTNTVAAGSSAAAATLAQQSNNVQLTALTANYNFGSVQAFGAAVQNSTSSLAGVNFAKTTTYELGVRAPVTPAVTLFASAFTGNRDGSGTAANSTLTGSNAITGALGDADVSGYQLGSIYNLSKRSSLYAIYGNQAIKGKSAQTTYKTESTGMAIGVRHSF